MTQSMTGEAPARLQATAAELAPRLLQDLKQRARRERQRVRAGETLRTSVLVNEAFLKLYRAGEWESELHFLRAAALAMRQALVDHARHKLAEKRGGGRVDSLEDHPGLEPSWFSDERLVELDEALQQLARESPRLGQVVECRFFGGYSDAETARILGVNERTVRRDWIKAQAWLSLALSDQPA